MGRAYGKCRINAVACLTSVPQYTIKEVSQYLKVTERTIYRLAAAEKIPGSKVGGAWRVSKVEIDQWIRRQSEDGASDDETANTGEQK